MPTSNREPWELALEVKQFMRECDRSAMGDDAQDWLDAACQPPTAGGVDERQAFETDARAICKDYEDEAVGRLLDRYGPDCGDLAGRYVNPRINFRWAGWQARAALRAPSAAPEQATYFCNKCGHYGADGPQHPIPSAGLCDYDALRLPAPAQPAGAAATHGFLDSGMRMEMSKWRSDYSHGVCEYEGMLRRADELLHAIVVADALQAATPEMKK